MEPRRILVPADFSEGAQAAIARASLLSAHGATIELLHVLAPSDVPPSGEPLLPWFSATREGREMGDCLGVLERSEVDAPLGRVALGRAIDVILELTSCRNYDLIVMGAHGQSHRRHPSLGSVADALVRGARCPVVAVPSTADRFDEFSEIYVDLGGGD